MPPCRHAAIVSVTLVVATTACGRGDRTDLSSLTPDTTVITMGPGDLMIVNADSSMELGVAGTAVVMRFGPRARRELRQSLDTSKIRSNNGIGAMIERQVKTRVGDMLNRRLEIPVADIDSVGYDGETIVFHYHGARRGMTFENMKNDRRPTLATFSPADSRAFVAAFQARKAALPVRQD